MSEKNNQVLNNDDKESNISKLEKKNTKNVEKESVNIFDEFSTDDSLEEEVNGMKKNESKDMFYYFYSYGKIIQVLFFILLVSIIVFGVYIYIQKSEDMNNRSFLDPVCTFFNGGIPNPESSCSSITYINSYYKNSLKSLEQEQSSSIISIIPTVYENANFLKTKEVDFLLDKTNNRLDVIGVLESFNKLKKDFTGIDKKKLICSDFKINAMERTLSIHCDTYSKGYENSIIGFSGEKNLDEVGGTSISIANSFLNYIEKRSKDFSLVERTKVFSSKKTILDSGYTRETPFDFKLKININN